MGSAQSTRPRIPTRYSSSYARLDQSSPSGEHLLRDDVLNESVYYEQNETTAKEISKKNTANEKTIHELERKTERLERLLFSNNAAMEKSLTTLQLKYDSLQVADSRYKPHETTIREINRRITSNEKKLDELGRQAERLEHLVLTKNVAMEKSFRELQERVDGLVFMSQGQNGMQAFEVDKGTLEPEYVDRVVGVILMLTFVVLVFIGMQL